MGYEALSLRELQVADCICRGLTNKQIGKTLHITENTVKNHVHSIINKLEVRSRLGIAMSLIATDRAGVDWRLIKPQVVSTHAKPLSA